MKYTLRPWSTNDLDSLVQYANNSAIAKNLTNQFPFPYTQENGRAFIENVSKANPLQVFAIDVDGFAVGGIGIHPEQDVYCKNAELGYWLAEPFWGKGIMTGAIKEMVQYGFEKFSIQRIFARPFGSNIGSQKALEKAGFILEARFEKTFYKWDQYEDELVYAIRK